MPESIIGTKSTLSESLQENETQFLCCSTWPVVFMAAQRIREELATLCTFCDCERLFCKLAKLS
jgi:hypothetical protein